MPRISEDEAGVLEVVDGQDEMRVYAGSDGRIYVNANGCFPLNYLQAEHVARKLLKLAEDARRRG